MNKIKSFKTKTYLAFGTIIFLSATLLFTVIRLFSILENLSDYVNRVDALKINVHRVKENENKMFLFDTKSPEFMKSGTSTYIPEMESYMDKMIMEMDYLLQHELTEDYDLEDDYTKIIEDFNNYTYQVHQGIEKLREKGYDEYGAAGQVNKDIQTLKVRSILSEYEVVVNEIEKLMYSYQLAESKEQSNMILEKINALVHEHQLAGDTLGLTSSLGNLKVSFTKYSALTHDIGLSGSEGIRSDLMKFSEEILNKCEKLEERVKRNVSHKKQLLYFGFSALAGLQVIFAVVFAFGMSTKLIRRLDRIKQNLLALSSGVFPNRIQLENSDELSEIAGAVNELTDRIEFAADFSRKIGAGELNAQYQEGYAEDALAKAIMEMQVKLKETAEIDRLRAWKTEGLAKFAGILQEYKDDATELNIHFLSNLVKYIGANQGIVYVIDHQNQDEEVLIASATYAYEREKHLDMRIEKGDGLVGEVWKEGETIVLTEIPEDYYLITSGLGETLPSCIVIIPLIYNEQIFGVLEMASLKVFNEIELDFLEELAKNLAGTLSGTKVAERTRQLLAQSNEMQNEMREQEEIMRQNIEEMQATQDTFDTREQELLKELEKYKKLAAKN